MKRHYKILLIMLMLILLIYVSNITSIPNSIIIFQGEKVNFRTVAGIGFSGNEGYYAVTASSNASSKIEDSSNEVGKTNYIVNLFR